ncbi:hypothetical protein R6Q59_028558 [Mikania micrantha]
MGKKFDYPLIVNCFDSDTRAKPPVGDSTGASLGHQWRSTFRDGVTGSRRLRILEVEELQTTSTDLFCRRSGPNICLGDACFSEEHHHCSGRVGGQQGWRRAALEESAQWRRAAVEESSGGGQRWRRSAVEESGGGGRRCGGDAD